MKNFIQLGEKKITLDPQNGNEVNQIVTACISILGAMVEIATLDIKDDKTRVEAALKHCGEIGGAIGQRAIVLIGSEKKSEEGESSDA